MPYKGVRWPHIFTYGVSTVQFTWATVHIWHMEKWIWNALFNNYRYGCLRIPMKASTDHSVPFSFINYTFCQTLQSMRACNLSRRDLRQTEFYVKECILRQSFSLCACVNGVKQVVGYRAPKCDVTLAWQLSTGSKQNNLEACSLGSNSLYVFKHH